MKEAFMKETSSIHRSGLSQERLNRLSRALQGYVEREEIAGMVVLIDRHDELAYANTIGWQDKEAQLPIKRNTLFRIASMTKPLIAVAALMLVEEGRIRLYDPVDAWLPELANRVVMRDPDGSLDDVYPSPRPITVHDLLTYRLGIGWGKSRLFPHLRTLIPAPFAAVAQVEQTERLDPDSWMARLGELPLLYEPGARWLYHVASEILGVLIARVAGMSLEAFLHERLFDPLGMVDTSFSVPPEKRSRLAVAYAPMPTGGLSVLDHPRSTGWADPPLFPSGGAGLVSSADDYLRFGRMLLRSGELDGIRLLSRKTVEAMTTDYLTPEQHTHAIFDQSEMWANKGFGYGVAVTTRRIGLGPSVGSFFWPGALGTTWYADPQEDLVATLLLQLKDAIVAAEWRNKVAKVGEDFLTLTYQAITD
jgi:CubicO group peptidase (beta-lactamase class C family)